MHPNQIFHPATASANLAFARARSFGMLAVNAEHGPLLSHIPFMLAEDGGIALLHLVRSNPIARMLATTGASCAAALAISGPDSYVSPDWYGVPDQVPTWNYVAVHLRGTLSRLDDADLRDLLDRQSAAYEIRLRPKTPWTIAKMTPGSVDKLLRQIVPFRFDVVSVDGTWKLGQNKTDAVRLAAADHIAAGAEPAGLAQSSAAIAALMKSPPHG